MFVASLPTWNKVVALFHVQADVGGSLEIAVFPAQVYSGPKRFQPDFEDAPSLNVLLYPHDTSPILRGSLAPFDDDPARVYDVIVFQWDHSPYDDGIMYMMVTITGPRYDGFPNYHCVASLSPISIQNKLLWFPDPPIPPDPVATISWAPPSDDDCADCDDLPTAFFMDIPGGLGGTSSPFTWGCSPDGTMRWAWGYDDTIPRTFANVQNPGSGLPVTEWRLDGPWDEVSPIVLPLFATSDPTMCGWPATITLTPP